MIHDSMFWHLTARGKASAVYYALRRLVARPAADGERCYMGAPVDPMVHCPRQADGLWCQHHATAHLAPKEGPESA